MGPGWYLSISLLLLLILIYFLLKYDTALVSGIQHSESVFFFAGDIPL